MIRAYTSMEPATMPAGIGRRIMQWYRRNEIWIILSLIAISISCDVLGTTADIETDNLFLMLLGPVSTICYCFAISIPSRLISSRHDLIRALVPAAIGFLIWFICAIPIVGITYELKGMLAALIAGYISQAAYVTITRFVISDMIS